MWSILKAWGVLLIKRIGMKKVKVAIASKAAIILDCLWVDRTSFEWSQPNAARFTSIGPISGARSRRRCPRRDGGWATLVNQLKAAPPHFVEHVKAPTLKVIMRRSATLERTVTPTPDIVSCMTKSSFIGGHVQLFAAVLAELRYAASFAR